MVGVHGSGDPEEDSVGLVADRSDRQGAWSEEDAGAVGLAGAAEADGNWVEVDAVSAVVVDTPERPVG